MLRKRWPRYLNEDDEFWIAHYEIDELEFRKYWDFLRSFPKQPLQVWTKVTWSNEIMVYEWCILGRAQMYPDGYGGFCTIERIEVYNRYDELIDYRDYSQEEMTTHTHWTIPNQSDDKFYARIYYYGYDDYKDVGFPQEEDPVDDVYQTNSYLDEFASELGLKRREFAVVPLSKIKETHPKGYLYLIEQDYWFEKRLLSEYNVRNTTRITNSRNKLTSNVATCTNDSNSIIGFLAFGDSELEIDTSVHKMGEQSLKVLSPGIEGHHGIRIMVTTGMLNSYTFSGWVLIPEDKTIEIVAYYSNDINPYPEHTITGTGDWYPFEYSFTNSSRNNVTSLVIKTGETDEFEFNIGQLQFETGMIANDFEFPRKIVDKEVRFSETLLDSYGRRIMGLNIIVPESRRVDVLVHDKTVYLTGYEVNDIIIEEKFTANTILQLRNMINQTSELVRATYFNEGTFKDYGCTLESEGVYATYGAFMAEFYQYFNILPVIHDADEKFLQYDLDKWNVGQLWAGNDLVPGSYWVTIPINKIPANFKKVKSSDIDKIAKYYQSFGTHRITEIK
jgi:hypothetical protein